MTIDLGPNTEDAKEVIDFVESGRLLQGSRLPDDIDAAVIHDLEEIPEQWDYCKYHWLTWLNILDRASGEYGRQMDEKWGPKYDDFPYHPLIKRLRDEEWPPRFKRMLKSKCVSEYIPHAIANDLSQCLECRIVIGRQNSIWELVFEIYKAGGLPCGWDGAYPEGRPIVFYPLAPNQAPDHRSIHAIPVDLGPHTQHAMEIIDFVESGQLLQGGDLPDDVDAVLIEDFDEIVPPDGYAFADDWHGLLGLHQIASRECDMECQKQCEVNTPFLYHRCLIWLRAQWRRRFARELNDEFVKRNLHRTIANFLVDCVENRILAGRRNELFELIFKVCKSGGLPCGWKGDYPRGNIAVYYPPPWQPARRD